MVAKEGIRIVRPPRDVARPQTEEISEGIVVRNQMEMEPQVIRQRNAIYIDSKDASL